MDTEKLNILYVCSECLPFAAGGGIADMMLALPKYLSTKEDLDIRVVMPLYKSIPEELKNDFRLVAERNVELSWRNDYCGIYEYELGEITYYFIDNKQYFDRDNLYGYDDDVERFSFFSKAVLDMLPMVSFFPDIIHANDWQTSLVCTFLKVFEWANPKYEHIKSVLTAHNLTFQGKTDFGAVRNLLGVDDKFSYLFDFFGQANIMKAGILCADQIVTVSETYKNEILNTEKGYGLQGVLQSVTHKLDAICNGIDYEYYNPATDDIIYQTYDAESLEKRKINKLKLQEELGLVVDENIPIYSFVGFMAAHKGFDLISGVIEKYLDAGIQFVAVGTIQDEYRDFLVNLNYKYPDHVHIKFGYDSVLARKIYAGADFLLNTSSVEPCGLCPMIANRYGTLPIVYTTGGLIDNFSDFKYNNGNGYILKNYDVNSLSDLLDRTLRNFGEKEKITNYTKTGMTQDFSIAECAEKYLEIYRDM